MIDLADPEMVSLISESNERLKGRSRSPAKKPPSGMAKTMDYLQAQCRLEGCSATILVEVGMGQDTRGISGHN